MSHASLKAKLESQDESEDPVTDDEGLSSVQYIGDGARCLQAIADKHNHDFLSYVLRLVVLETEIMTEKCGLVVPSSKKCPK